MMKRLNAATPVLRGIFGARIRALRFISLIRDSDNYYEHSSGKLGAKRAVSTPIEVIGDDNRYMRTKLEAIQVLVKLN